MFFAPVATALSNAKPIVLKGDCIVPLDSLSVPVEVDTKKEFKGNPGLKSEPSNNLQSFPSKKIGLSIVVLYTTNPDTGRPVPEPVEFYIDIDICMNCGFCAEFCPFDAIKMDHDYELATFDRTEAHIYNKERLMKPAKYYAEIRPQNWAREEQIRLEKAEKKKAAEAAKAARAAEKAKLINIKDD